MRRKSRTTKPDLSWHTQFEEAAVKQRALVAGLHSVHQMLEQMDGTFDVLMKDEHFRTLLRAEGLDQLPVVIVKRIRP